MNDFGPTAGRRAIAGRLGCACPDRAPRTLFPCVTLRLVAVLQLSKALLLAGILFGGRSQVSRGADVVPTRCTDQCTLLEVARDIASRQLPRLDQCGAGVERCRPGWPRKTGVMERARLHARQRQRLGFSECAGVGSIRPRIGTAACGEAHSKKRASRCRDEQPSGHCSGVDDSWRWHQCQESLLKRPLARTIKVLCSSRNGPESLRKESADQDHPQKRSSVAGRLRLAAGTAFAPRQVQLVADVESRAGGSGRCGLR